MAAGVAAFTIDNNADFVQQLIWTDVNGNPVDLTGYSANMSIANHVQPGATIFYTLSSTGTPNSDITFVALDGIINLFIPASATTTFTFTNAVYDLLVTDTNSITTRLLMGPITISSGVTAAP
jgi:hypothetical protein